MISTFSISIPSKVDVMKQQTHDFLQNERLSAASVDVNNVGNNTLFENGEASAQPTTTPNEEALLEEETIEDVECSRTLKPQISEISVVTDSSTDFSGSAPKRYTTTCFITPKNIPYWYSETVFLNIGSTKKAYHNKIFFREKIVPTRWSEEMRTEITTFPKCILSEEAMQVEDVFIKLESTGA